MQDLKEVLTDDSSGSKLAIKTFKNDTNYDLSFHVGNPEGIHELIHLFSDRGTPASLRYMNAYSGHTYKFTKEVCLG